MRIKDSGSKVTARVATSAPESSAVEQTPTSTPTTEAEGDRSAERKDVFEQGGNASFPKAASPIPENAPPRISAHDLQMAHPPKAQAGEKPQVRLELSQRNDNLPAGMVPEEHLDHKGFADDDGWTAEVGAKAVVTMGDRQIVGQARTQMVTERRNDPGPGGYGARREDITEYALQVNQSDDVNPKTKVLTGFGIGLQRIGPQGLDKLQQWFHHATQETMGGRKDFADPSSPMDGLQSQYSSNIVSNAAILTGGVGVVHQPFANKVFSLTAGAEGTIPLGPGLGSIRAGAGFELRPIPNLVIEGGVALTGSYVTTDKLDFISPEGVRPEAKLGLEYQIGGRVGVLAQVKVGGLRDEPSYSVALVFGLGAEAKASWLDPLD